MPAGKTDVIFFDDATAGFGYRLRKGAGGKVLRSWVCQYRHAGATPSADCSVRPTVLGAEQARTMAKKALGRVANGEDPQADRLDRRGKDKHTFKATVADYWRSSSATCARAPTPSWRAISPAPYFRPLHGLALDQITRKDVASRLNRITLGEQLDCGRARPRDSCPRCSSGRCRQASSRPTR